MYYTAQDPSHKDPSKTLPFFLDPSKGGVMAGIYLALALYSIGGFWCVLTVAKSAREMGCAHRFRVWIGLAALAFLLWPLLLSQSIFHSIRNRGRNRAAQSREDRCRIFL